MSITLWLLLAGCQGSNSWHTASIAHHLPDLAIEGISDRGVPLDANSMRGKVVLLYFGFTHCAEDCPLVMSRLAHLIAQLGGDGNDLRVLFVSLDPSRDKPQVLKDYLALFDASHSVGVSASIDATEAMARRYRIAFYRDQKRPLAADLPHSNAVYAFDRQGQVRLLITPDDSDQAVLLDLRRLLAPEVGS